MSKAVDMYYLPQSPPCRSVLLAARAAGVNINLITLNILGDEHLTPAFLKMNPEHTIPTMNDNGLIIWESRAMMAYFINQYAKDPASQALYPKDPRKRAMVDQRLYFDGCSLWATLVDYFLPVLRKWNIVPDEAKRMKFEKCTTTLDNMLGNHPWVAGDSMSIADIACIVTINTAEDCLIDMKRFKHVQEWRKRCEKGMAKFGYEEIEIAGSNILKQCYKKALYSGS